MEPESLSKSSGQKRLCAGWIGVAGPIRGGKSTVAKKIAQSGLYRRLSFGEMIYGRAVKAGLEPTRLVLQQLGSRMVREMGYVGITEMLLEKAPPGCDLVIDGIRHIEVNEYLRRKSICGYSLVYVDAPFMVRFDRARKAQPSLTAEQFTAMDTAPIEQGTILLRDHAQCVLNNDTANEQLDQQVSELLGKLASQCSKSSL